MTWLFVLLAAVAVFGALGVVVAKTPVHSVLAMILNFIALSLLFLTLNAEFMAVIQLIVYAGAIMILFLFVVALLTVRKDPVEGPVDTLRGQTQAAVILGLGSVLMLAAAGISFRVGGTVAAPAPGNAVNDTGFGKVVEFGHTLLTKHVLPFEMTAFILMVAVIGVVILVGRKAA